MTITHSNEQLFDAESTRDRGSLSKEKFAEWCQAKEEADLQFRKFDMDKCNTSSERRAYEKAKNLEAELRRRTIFLGHKAYWLAIKSDDVRAVIDWLGFDWVEKTKWDLYTLPSHQMSKANTEPWSLITPPCDGVVYVDCKYWGLDHKSLTSLMQDIDEPLRKLSGYGSSVYYLWSERVSGEHGYAFWQGGDLKRAVLSSQREFSTLGQPYDDEPEFDFFEINNGKPKKI